LHRAIFSDKERGMIKEYIESGKQGEGLRVLNHRVNKHESVIISDFKLMVNFKATLLLNLKISQDETKKRNE